MFQVCSALDAMIDSDSAPDLVLDLTTAGEHRYTRYDPHIYDHDHDNQDSHDFNHCNHEIRLNVIMALFSPWEHILSICSLNHPHYHTYWYDYRTIWHQDNLAPRTIWHRGQFGTTENLAP